MKHIFGVDMELKLDNLLIYRGILQDSLVKKVKKLFEMEAAVDISIIENCYFDICSDLISEGEKYGIVGDVWKNHILNLILMDENVFSLSCENFKINEDSSLYNAAFNDLKIIIKLYNVDFSCIRQYIRDESTSFVKNYTPVSPAKITFFNDKIDDLRKSFDVGGDIRILLNKLINHYNFIGSGILARFSSLYWNDKKGIKGIENPDPITFDDLIGYKEQKETLINNTEAFVNGKDANNVLLFGDRGTGKSSSVKALVNKYAERGLRLLEVSKNQICYIPEMIKVIKNHKHRVILFIDDLSFEENETDYKYLKSVIEGRAEAKPDNVLIYATSNRRHLIKETWSDRDKGGEEIHASDSIQEKLSLADRFGITITFLSPGQEEYLKIVEALAEKNKINISRDELRQKAIQWELWYNGRSARTATQFIKDLLGK